jgi:uncharacterized protein
MPRPPECRRIAKNPLISVFKPAGIPAREMEMIDLTLDEFEAIRLADLEGLYQEDAAEKMGISRPTFGRIIESAHRKVAQALVRGQALVIRGGNTHSAGQHCPRCQNDR